MLENYFTNCFDIIDLNIKELDSLTNRTVRLSFNNVSENNFSEQTLNSVLYNEAYSLIMGDISYNLFDNDFIEKEKIEENCSTEFLNKLSSDNYSFIITGASTYANIIVDQKDFVFNKKINGIGFSLMSHVGDIKGVKIYVNSQLKWDRNETVFGKSKVNVFLSPNDNIENIDVGDNSEEYVPPIEDDPWGEDGGYIKKSIKKTEKILNFKYLVEINEKDFKKLIINNVEKVDFEDPIL